MSKTNESLVCIVADTSKQTEMTDSIGADTAEQTKRKNMDSIGEDTSEQPRFTEITDADTTVPT